MDMKESKPSIKKQDAGQLRWFKNVARSMGYSATELISGLTPSMSEFVTTNFDYATELAESIKEMRSDGGKITDALSGINQIDTAKKALKNALEDLRTGKFYNKERIDSSFEDDFSLEDFSFGDESSSSPTIKVAPPMSNNNPMVKAIGKQQEITVKTSQAQIDTISSIGSAQMMLSQKLGGSLLKGIESMNENLALLVNFQSESTAKYIGASLKYYEESLTTLKLTLDEIKRGNPPELPEQKVSANPIDDVIMYNGGLNLKGYIGRIKKNIENEISSNMILSQLKAMFDDDDTLKFLAQSPLQFLSSKMVSMVLPSFLQTSMRGMDDTFKNFFPALMMKLNGMKGNSNFFLDLIGKFFGVEAKTKSSVDFAKYNRGQIPFDGETKKAITEVIPTYLRKILAAINGQEEIALDYRTGRWTTVENMKESYKRKTETTILGAYGDELSKLMEMSNAIAFDSIQDRIDFNKGIEKFFLNLTQNPGLVNPNLRKDEYGSVVDQLTRTYDFGSQGANALFREMIMQLSNREQLKLFGANVINSRKAKQDLFLDMEKDPAALNANILLSGLGFDEHLKKDKDLRTITKKKGFGLLNPIDKYGHTSLDYLRDIKKVLVSGIRVFTSGAIAAQGGTTTEEGTAKQYYEKAHDDMLADEVREREKSARSIRYRYRNMGYFDENSQTKLEKLQSQGRMAVESVLDLGNMSPGQIESQLEKYISTTGLREDREKKANQKKSISQWLGRFFTGDTQEKYNLIREKINDFLEKPAQLLKGVFDKIDQSMYTIVFGRRDGGTGEVSFMDVTMARLRETFDNLGIFVREKVFEPIREAFLGKDGIVTKIKDSQFYDGLKEKWGKAKDYLFGKSVDGRRENGLLGDAGNAFLDIWDGFKYYFTGKAYTNRAGVKFDDNKEGSVFGIVNNSFKNFAKDMKTYFVGDKNADNPHDKKGVLSGVIEGMHKGFQNWKDALFGPSGLTDKHKEDTLNELSKSLKEKMPKAVAWGTIGAGVGVITSISGGMGLLGGLMLPGGPIGMAVLGTAAGLLSQSEKFKEWLFGYKDNQGNRMGGVISASVIDFFKKNRIPILGGAALGTVKAFLGGGILSGLLGGPVAGALLGTASALVFRSEGFQKLMFGEVDPSDPDGKRKGGLVHKMFSKVKGFKDKSFGESNVFGNAAVGALGGAGIAAIIGKMGVLGAALTPGGLIGGALLGVAGGIALSSEKWKKMLFGDWDEETGLRKGGLFGKLNNWFKIEVAAPMSKQVRKLYIDFNEWFTSKIANPFERAIEPMKAAFKYLLDDMKDMFKAGWDSFRSEIGGVFERFVGKPFGEFMQENVMKPLKGFLMKILRVTTGVFKPIAEAPIKVLSAVGDGLREKHKKRGLDKHIEEGWEHIKDREGRSVRGERMGLFSTRDANGNKVGKGILNQLGSMYLSSKDRENAMYGENGAYYAKELDERMAKKEKEQKEKFAAQRAKLEEDYADLDKRRALAFKHDYDNFTADGVNISRFYNITKSKSSYKHFMKNSNEVDNYKKTLSERFGFGVHELLGLEDDRIDWTNLSKAQRKKITKAIKSGLTGQALKNKFGIKTITPAVSSTDSPSESPVKAVADNVTHSFKTVGDNLTHTIREESPKDEIRNNLTPEVKSSGMKLSSILDKMTEIGSKISPFKSKKETEHETLHPVPKTFSTHKPSSEVKVHQEHEGYSEVDRKLGKKEKISGSPLNRIAQYTRIIAAEVRGQLDGVGSNVYKIRRIVQKANGISDSDLKGSSNRDRVGFLGKLRRSFFSPFEALRDKFISGLTWVSDKIKGFGSAIFSIGKAIVKIPVDIAKGLGKGIATITKGLWSGFVGVTKELAKVPGLIIGVAGETFKAAGTLLTSTIKGFGTILHGAAKGVSAVLEGTGQAIGGVIKGIGEVGTTLIDGVAKITASLTSFVTKGISTMLSIGGEIVKQTGKLLTNITTSLVDFSLTTIKGVGNVVKDASIGLLEIVTSPIRFFSKSIGKVLGTKRQEVFVTGGSLDSVGTIHVINNVVSLEDIKGGTIDYIEGLGKIIDCISICDSGGGGKSKGKSKIPSMLKAPSASKVVGSIGSAAKGAASGAVGKVIPFKPNKTQAGGKTGGVGNVVKAFTGGKTGAGNNKGSKVIKMPTVGKHSFTTHGSLALKPHAAGTHIPKNDARSKLREKLDSRKEHVSRRNVNFEMQRRSQLALQTAESDYRNEVTRLLTSIDASQREMIDNFGGAFGKRGLITGILAAISGWLLTKLPELLKFENLFKHIDDILPAAAASRFIPAFLRSGGKGGKTGGASGKPGKGGKDGKSGKPGKDGTGDKGVVVTDSKDGKTPTRSGKNPKPAGKFGKVAGTLVKGTKFLGKTAASFIPGGNFLLGAANAYAAQDRAAEIFGLEEGQKATVGQRTAAAVAGATVGSIPGLGAVDVLLDGKITDIATKFTYKAGEYTKMAWDKTKELTGKAWEKTKEVASAAWDKTKEIASSAWGKTKEVASAAWDKTKEIATGAWDKTKKIASTAWEKTKDITGKAADIVSDVGKTVWNKTKEIAKNVWDKTSEFTADVWENTKKAVGGAWDGIKGFFSGAWNGVKDFLGINSVCSKCGAPLTCAKCSSGVGGGCDCEAEKQFQRYGTGPQVGGVYYSQNDPRWSGMKVDKSGKGMNFGQAGCGPTSAAMALSDVTGKQITPKETLKYAQDKGFIDGARGTRSDYFKHIGAEYGVNFAETTNNEDVIKGQLRQNKPVILHGDGGKAYTKNGHYIVATGVSRDGNTITVKDPMSKNGIKQYNSKSLMQNTTSGYTPTDSSMNKSSGKIIPFRSPHRYGAGTSGTGVFAGWRITSPYGMRSDPFNGTRVKHTGIDLVKYDKYPIPSFTNGEVVYAEEGKSGTGYGGYGNVVAVKDERGYTHLYGHLHSISVRKGDKITKGTIVGKQGNTGRSTGSHLHYEVRQNGYGSDVDPGEYLKSYVANKDFVPSKSTDSGSNGSSSEESRSFYNSPFNDPFTTTTGDFTKIFTKMSGMALFGEDPTANNVSTTENSTPYKVTGGAKLPFNMDNFVPKNEKEAILKKTVELTVSNETGEGNYFAAKNGIDSNKNRISPDLGIFQWRGNTAQRIMQTMSKRVPNDPDLAHFANDVDWNNRTPWSDAEQQRLQNALRKNPDVTKDVQNEFARKYAENTNLKPVYTYGVETGKISDPRSIVMLGEFANTGPAHVSSFLEKYTKASGGDEFTHFVDQFRQKSYWGTKGNGIYDSRIQKDINALNDWKTGFGIGGGDDSQNKFGDGYVPDRAYVQGLGEALSNKLTSNQQLERTQREFTLPEIDSSSTRDVNYGTGLSSGEIQELISILKDIRSNTKETSTGIISLSGKPLKSNNGDNNLSSTTVNVNNIQGSKVQSTSSETFNVKKKKDYDTAKKIASGDGRL